jgi:hypothetical protein
MESGRQFCFDAFGRNLASVALNMFSHLIYFIKMFYLDIFYLYAIFKGNATVNLITAQPKRDHPHPTVLTTPNGYSRIRSNPQVSHFADVSARLTKIKHLDLSKMDENITKKRHDIYI